VARELIGCGSGMICGCDGQIHDNFCAAIEAGTKKAELSACTRPENVIECLDQYCAGDGAQICVIYRNYRCAGGACTTFCETLPPTFYAECVTPAVSCTDPFSCDCTPAGCGQCMTGEEGITVECPAGCYG
jgi:hypothetical protein